MPTRAGQSSAVLGRLQLLRRLLWLIAPPRQHLVRCAGVLAPAAKLRPRVTPTGRSAVQGVWFQDRAFEPVVPPRRRVPWAKLLAKTFERQDVGSAGEGRKPKPAEVHGLSCPMGRGLALCQAWEVRGQELRDAGGGRPCVSHPPQ